MRGCVGSAGSYTDTSDINTLKSFRSDGTNLHHTGLDGYRHFLANLKSRQVAGALSVALSPYRDPLTGQNRRGKGARPTARGFPIHRDNKQIDTVANDALCACDAIVSRLDVAD